MWKTGTIGDVLSVIQNGVNCHQDKSGKGLKISRIETIADANINYNKTGFSNLDENQKQKAALNKGDILFSHINSPIHVGKTAIYDGSEPLYHGINLLRLNTIEGVDSNYFNFFLQSLFWSGYWRRTAKQSVNQASVNQTDIKKIPFAYPPLAEQERIVAKLDAAFAEIDEAVEHAQLKARNASNLYDGFLDNVLETNKKVPLIEACDRITDGSHHSPKTLSNEFPYITVKDISDDKIDFNNCKFVSKSFYQELVQNNCNPSMGDVLFSKDGTVGKVSLIDYEKDFVVLSSLAIISPNKDIINPRFLYYSLKSKSFINEAIGKKTGAAIRRIILKTLKNIKISIPELDEQDRLISVLDKFTIEHEKLNSSLKLKVLNLQQLKSSILNQNLSRETKGNAA